MGRCSATNPTVRRGCSSQTSTSRRRRGCLRGGVGMSRVPNPKSGGKECPPTRVSGFQVVLKQLLDVAATGSLCCLQDPLGLSNESCEPAFKFLGFYSVDHYAASAIGNGI